MKRPAAATARSAKAGYCSRSPIDLARRALGHGPDRGPTLARAGRINGGVADFPRLPANAAGLRARFASPGSSLGRAQPAPLNRSLLLTRKQRERANKRKHGHTKSKKAGGLGQRLGWWTSTVPKKAGSMAESAIGIGTPALPGRCGELVDELADNLEARSDRYAHQSVLGIIAPF
jgi:hypothetical protein